MSSETIQLRNAHSSSRYLCKCVSVHVCVYVCVCVWECVCGCMCVNMSWCGRLCVYVCVYARECETWRVKYRQKGQICRVQN